MGSRCSNASGSYGSAIRRRYAAPQLSGDYPVELPTRNSEEPELGCPRHASGSGLVVVDARGDLIPDILSRVPESRRDDVIVIDPSETARPVGFNVLRIGTAGEQGRERAV